METKQVESGQAETSSRYRAGVAKWLDLIISEIEALRGAVQAALVERRRGQPEQRHGRN